MFLLRSKKCKDNNKTGTCLRAGKNEAKRKSRQNERRGGSALQAQLILCKACVLQWIYSRPFRYRLPYVPLLCVRACYYRFCLCLLIDEVFFGKLR